MIAYFPPSKGVDMGMQEALQLHTKHIDATPLGFAERVGAHYTALLSAKRLKRNNTTNGRYFTVCVYDALIARGVDPGRIALNARASLKHVDDIDLKITLPPVDGHGDDRFVLFYLKTSLRERWKQVDRDAEIARRFLSRTATTICLMYSEGQAQGYAQECQSHVRLDKQLRERESWAMGVDYYMALSQKERVNALVDTLFKDTSEGSAA